VIHELVDFRGKDVIEMGAGDGRLTWRYADLSASVLALEPKELRVEQARQATPVRLHRRATFRVADATMADLPTGAFDVVVFSRSL
jgi:2-polyprenyl-3-methyl-5-hydroxy-6-metoxy-1,4-benzoquinol methylase